MPKGPQGQKRPADVIGAAVRVARIATGEEEDDDRQEMPKIGSTGGNERAKKIGKRRRSEIAQKAAKARWAKERCEKAD